jgi:hypothetical protein
MSRWGGSESFLRFGSKSLVSGSALVAGASDYGTEYSPSVNGVESIG